MTFENSKALISATVLCLCKNLSMIWHGFLEISSLPACDGACVVCAWPQQCLWHVPLSWALLLDLLPYLRVWCFWQLYLRAAKMGERGIKALGIRAAWWRGRRDIPSYEAASVGWPRWALGQGGSGDITVPVLALLVMLNEFWANKEGCGHSNIWVIFHSTVYVFSGVSSFFNIIYIMLFALLAYVHAHK